ncbi:MULTISPECIES: 1-phosphofructokinase [unclassified Cytobacillus]|uniref:1-phosphofructokinase n=1 Tax=unclassified Cytobacillus TaxID=2675268 RepID=UPI00135CC832|nr:1-phosphofructokinase [Cytobacillus sp. AMY 15.2]KAF0819793.1 1-phosphofructokinase [Bacillus sp. ZZV12-4809]MCM3092331.1 1-phosphofructokinase [Cytobacillus sp. AMY 15.2]
MIYTLTLNPSVDYIAELDEILVGGLNRMQRDTKFPGGKGINVSRVLKRMDVESRALGFAGGFTGDYLVDCLNKENIQTDFVQVNDDTRINVKIKTETETEINAKGPAITGRNFEDLKNKIRSLSAGDMLVLAGSIPSTLPETTYEELVKICSKNGAAFVVDAEGELLKKVLPYKPFLIKPNHHELGEIFSRKFTSAEEVIPFGKKLVEMGAQNVIVSLAGKGAVLVSNEAAYISSVPKGKVKSSVGAGDSMVAGFLAAYEKNQNIEKAFQYSVATGSATAFSLGLCTKEKAEELLSQVSIEKVSLKGEI